MIIGGMLMTTPPQGAVRLADWGLIRAQGADTVAFLQGQLTQDVSALADHTARLAGFCSAKGRLQASFVLWRADDAAAPGAGLAATETAAAQAAAAATSPTAVPTIDLACSADLLAATLRRLSMFVLRAKCKLSDVSAQVALYGLAGDSATHWLNATAAGPAPTAAWGVQLRGVARAIRLPDSQPAAGNPAQPRYLLAQPAALPAPDLPALSSDDWAWLEVHSGVARITAATVDAFVPQMVNLDLVGGVNFQKGCYPGQEVVARSQYRGTLKRRALVFDSAAPLAAGQDVFHSADPGQPAGRVVLAAARPGGGSSALVEIKLAALDSGSLHASNLPATHLPAGSLPASHHGVAQDMAAARGTELDAGVLVRGALPYDIPAMAATSATPTTPTTPATPAEQG